VLSRELEGTCVEVMKRKGAGGMGDDSDKNIVSTP
jgi:hypothetical protein